MSKKFSLHSRLKDDHQGELHKMRRFGSTNKFLVKGGWMFVGAFKKGWYKIRMNLNF
ncbi:hypothetical protein SESBI_41246 [Sesbania bispinosa]|nr:hypothetical protein SESBI_41246 [Sesbania bispinosa]